MATTKKAFANGFNELAAKLNSRLRIDSKDKKTKFYKWNGSYSQGYEVVVLVNISEAGRELTKHNQLAEYLEQFN
jgi:hypothetical protein